ncbi:hypothetical protein Rhopal_007209-T1 [Rhodotorula paludigena]|uniref:F-box domain-containing protein n=1 Tax=Rhodotorula paludigena TaxID=86838 RepID=A0AAV5GW05_9BASI|nr:hypothetical protein Rhopal_007209-T1 [Rhodotorula paludigena]
MARISLTWLRKLGQMDTCKRTEHSTLSLESPESPPQEPRAPATLLSLPDELLAHILELAVERKGPYLAPVCSRFRMLVREIAFRNIDIWTHATMHTFMSTLADSDASIGEVVRSVVCYAHDDTDQPESEMHCDLTLAQTALSRLPNLESLELHWVQCLTHALLNLDASQHLQCLSTFAFTFPDRATTLSDLSALAHLPALDALDVYIETRNLPTFVPSPAGAALPRITSLRLAGGLVPSPALTALVALMPSVTRLALSNKDSYRPRERDVSFLLMQLLPAPEKLESLTVTGESFYPPLTLSLSPVAGSPSSAPANPFARLTKLTDVTIEGDTIRPDPLRDALAALPALERLALRGGAGDAMQESALGTADVLSLLDPVSAAEAGSSCYCAKLRTLEIDVALVDEADEAACGGVSVTGIALVKAVADRVGVACCGRAFEAGCGT